MKNTGAAEITTERTRSNEQRERPGESVWSGAPRPGRELPCRIFLSQDRHMDWSMASETGKSPRVAMEMDEYGIIENIKSLIVKCLRLGGTQKVWKRDCMTYITYHALQRNNR